ncbi:MAG: glycosyltransferase family 4 protein [bacterium]|nr:glycosyltransferase family 4 protein [bacterium]
MKLLIITHTTPNTPTKDGMALILYYIKDYLEKAHSIDIIAQDQFETIEAFTKELEPIIDEYDVIYLHGPNSLKLLPHFRHDRNIVAGVIDVQSYKYSQLAERESSTLQKRKWLKQQKYWEDFEKENLANVSHIIVGTEADYNAIKKTAGSKPFVTAIPNGVDNEYFQPDASIEKEHAIIFSGMLDQASHTQSILYFYKNIWPKIIDHDATAPKKWYIVGRDPSKKIMQLHKKDKRIIVTGFVPEVKEFLLRCKVFVSPLHMRSGIKNTVLEALACGLPVVGFRDACTGLEASPIRKVATDLDFSNTVKKLLEDDAECARVGDQSRKYIIQHHNWEEHSRTYEKVFTQASQA